MANQTALKPRIFLRRLIWPTLFAVIAAAVFYLVDFLLTDDVHVYTRYMLNELYAQQQNVDVLFVGSSHCYRSFDPALADELLGENTFNAGSSQQLPDGSFYMLQEAAKTNRIKTVYLEMYCGTMAAQQSRDLPMACYLLTDYIKPSVEQMEYLWEMGGAAALFDHLFPFRHNTISPGEIVGTWKAKLQGFDPTDYSRVRYPEEEYRGKGFCYVHVKTNEATDFAVGSPIGEEPIGAMARAYLQKMAAFCQEQGIELILVTAPMPDAFLMDIGNYQHYVEAVRTFAQENAVGYWDFNLYKGDFGFTYEDFSDAHHLSGQGADTFTRTFAQLAVQPGTAIEKSESAFFETYAEKCADHLDVTATGTRTARQTGGAA